MKRLLASIAPVVLGLVVSWFSVAPTTAVGIARGAGDGGHNSSCGCDGTKSYNCSDRPDNTDPACGNTYIQCNDNGTDPSKCTTKKKADGTPLQGCTATRCEDHPNIQQCN